VPATSVVIDGGQITLDNNKNTAAQGGAIFTRGSVAIGNDASIVKLTNNHSGTSGGAIEAYGSTASAADGVFVSVLGSDIDISGNSTDANVGGAIYVEGELTIGSASTTRVMLSGDHDDSGWGGALFAYKAQISGQDITLTDNHTTASGGAIYAEAGGVTLGNAGSTVVLSDNTATFGGAVYSEGDVTVLGGDITLADNDTTGGAATQDKTNMGFDLASPDAQRDGDDQGIRIATGATSARIAAKAGSWGGAIYSEGNVSIGNPGGGSVFTIAGNKATYGGAMVSEGATTLTGSGAISGNKDAYGGGAILSFGDVTLNAAGGDIVFSGNTAGAIWLENDAAPPATATFNAASGKIVFFDPIANEAANGLIDVTTTGPGAVVFDGAGNVSPVYGATTVASGAWLEVRNGAVYGALAADVGGAAGGSSFTAGSGTTLAGGGTGTVRADQFVLHGTLNVAGTAPAGTAAGGFSVFNIASGSINLSGSTLKLNTCLNDAGTQRSDTLNLTGGGAITGAVILDIKPAFGCTGGITTGDGILLVHAGSSSASLFVAGKVAASAGGYDYKLVQVGDDWYLQSSRGGGAGNATAIPTLDPLHLAALALLLTALAALARRRV
jgi:predicted outer membrane repeat protein